MKYCMHCGGELLKNTETKYTCTSCQHEQFHNPKGAIAILLFDSTGKIILARRAHDPHEGKLGPIGGFLDNSECFEDALYRELDEETGLQPEDIMEVSYIGSAFDKYLWRGEETPVVSAYFTAQLTDSKQPVANDDVASLVAFELNAVKLSELAWPGLVKMLDKIRETTAA